MRRIALMISLLVLCAPVFAQPYKQKPGLPAVAWAKAGPFAVETASFDWTDAARNREVPVKIYYPKDGAGTCPLIVFSHGLGGSREGYEYLGRHWASHGYVSVHVQHKGSDTEV